MLRLILVALVTTLGGNLLLHFLRNFSLQEKRKIHLEADALVERLLITLIIINYKELWFLILAIIIVKIVYRFYRLGLISQLFQNQEPGTAFQKVILKTELAFDLLLSPTFAILVGAIFR